MKTIFAKYNPHRNSIDVCPLHDQSRTALAASFSIFIKPAMIPSTMLPTTAPVKRVARLAGYNSLTPDSVSRLPDFRPYKVSLTRIFRFRVGLVGALWLSLQDYLRFVLTFQCPMQPDQGKKIPRWFPNEACDACRSTKCFLDLLGNCRHFSLYCTLGVV